MTTIILKTVIDPPWLRMPPVRIGRIPTGLGTPNRYALVEKDGEPYLRVDIYAYDEDGFIFEQAAIWQNFAVIGFGNHVYLIHLASEEVKTFDLGRHFNYFGHLYLMEDCLLIASGMRLYKVDLNGALIWTSPELGIDGVVVNSINDGIIYGTGEWDPPGGWKPFRVELSSGRLL